MKELKFQQKAVRKLVDEVIDLLRLSGYRKTLIFKASRLQQEQARQLWPRKCWQT